MFLPHTGRLTDCCVTAINEKAYTGHSLIGKKRGREIHNSTARKTKTALKLVVVPNEAECYELAY